LWLVVGLLLTNKVDYEVTESLQTGVEASVDPVGMAATAGGAPLLPDALTISVPIRKSNERALGVSTEGRRESTIENLLSQSMYGT